VIPYSGDTCYELLYPSYYLLTPAPSQELLAAPLVSGQASLVVGGRRWSDGNGVSWLPAQRRPLRDDGDFVPDERTPASSQLLQQLMTAIMWTMMTTMMMKLYVFLRTSHSPGIFLPRSSTNCGGSALIRLRRHISSSQHSVCRAENIHGILSCN